jgi:two-component system, OmpR family, aerobic respiration control sensor histidine kinase ArcB
MNKRINVLHETAAKQAAKVKSHKEELKEKQQQIQYLENIIAAMPCHIYWQDRKGKVLGCNDEQASSLGFKTKEELIGKTIFDLQPRKYATKIAATNQKVIKTKKLHTVEESAMVSGKELIYLSNKIPLFDKQHNVIGLVGMSIDITAQKQLEKKLKEAKEKAELAIQARDENLAQLNRVVTGQTKGCKKSAAKNALEVRDYLENIIALMPGHVYWQDRKGAILGCNDQQAKSFGIDSRKDIIGKTAYDFLPKGQADLLTQLNEKVMRSNKKYVSEESGIMGDGKLHTYISQKVPLHNPRGKVVGILGTSMDITERKRTEQLLLETKEKAEAANQAKSTFISNMEHDLRTPTSGIYGLVKILAEYETDPEKKENLNMVLESANELLTLLNEILEFNQIESGNQPVVAKKFNLHEFLDNVIKLEKSSAKTKKIPLIKECDSNIPEMVIGDAFRLNRIMINLIGNAIKFTLKGHIKLAVKLGKQLSNRVVILQFIVEDTGIGIPEEKQNVIFEKFNKLELSNVSKYKGGGMGLRIVKKFVEDLDGDIEIESEPKVGTKFICTIPFKIPLLN